MFGKAAKSTLLILLVIAVGFFSSSCEKLGSGRLQANYYFSRGNHYFSDGLYRKAIAEYEQALKHNPELGDIYRFLGEAYKNIYRPGVDTPENKEKEVKALEALQKAYELYPTNKDVILSLGDMYDKMRSFEEAEKFYLRILEMEPGNMDNYYVVAEFYKRYAGGSKEEEGESVEGKGPFEKAEEMYLRRIEADPENPQGYAYAAQFYESLTPIPDFDKANYFHAIRSKLEPERAEIYYTIGVNRFYKAYRLQRRLSLEERKTLANESREALMKAIELEPNYPEPYSYMKIIYINLFANLEPDKASRYKAEAERYGDKFQELRKRQLERKRLEEELQRTVRER